MNLVRELHSPEVDIFRISPQSQHSEHVIQIYHDCLHGRMAPDDAAAALEPLMPTGPCDGYWYGQAGMAAGCSAA
jgi:hypothetical protein